MMPELAVQSKPQSICVVRVSAIGDTCHALAVVRRLQDNWPDTRITWIIGKTEASLMAGVEGVELILFDKSRGRRAYDEVQKQFEDRRFDVALCMHASMRINLLCRSIPADVRLGFDRARARDFQWLFTNKRIPAAAGEHALEAMMGFATAIGAEPRPLRWDLPLPSAAADFAAQYTDPQKRLVVISPCSSQRSRNFRNWSIASYAATIDHLQRNYDCTIVLTGGKTELEQEYGQVLAACAEPGVINLIGKTALTEVAATIAAADLVICPDSGPAHMATALGTAVIGLYATSNPARTGPYLSQELTVNRYPDAVQQYLHKGVDSIRWGRRVRHPDAMDLITVDDVTSAIDRFMAGG